MNCLKGTFRSLVVCGMNENERVPFEMVPWLPLYRVWGQGMYKEGSPDRGVMSLREGPS